jgi:hypothetical protein
VNFDLGSDDIALQESLRGRFPVERVRKGFDRTVFDELREWGLFDELSAAHAVLAFEELGRAIVPGPLIASHLAGTGRVTALLEDRYVEHLDGAEDVLDAASGGIVAASGVRGEPVARPLDPLTPMHRVGEIAFVDHGPDVRLRGAAVTAAFLVGIASATTEIAVAYARERVQFGRPIGSFQAVKHMCADMLVRTEVARASVYAAGVLLDDGGGDVERAVRGAKLIASEAAFVNGKTCIQVHGGMGFTWEVDAHLYLKRAAVLSATFGSPDEHARAIAATL